VDGHLLKNAPVGQLLYDPADDALRVKVETGKSEITNT
jgi:hypothetical protein